MKMVEVFAATDLIINLLQRDQHLDNMDKKSVSKWWKDWEKGFTSWFVKGPIEVDENKWKECGVKVKDTKLSL